MRRKPLPTYAVNGWLIEKRPNTFAESYAYEASAADVGGYQTMKQGFRTLKEARAFCREYPAPGTKRAGDPGPAMLAALFAPLTGRKG